MTTHRRWLPLAHAALAAALVACATDDPAAEAPPALEATALRRLSPVELHRAVEALLSPDAPLAPFPLPADVQVNGFEEQVIGQQVSTQVIEAYQRAAATFAAVTPTAPAFRPCRLDREGVDGQRPCARQAVLATAEAAFRRPLRDDERARLGDLFDAGVAEVGVPGAARLAVEAILQDPSFLYLPEEGTEDGLLTPWELAARLSFLLWDAPPDDALRAAAAAGELQTAESVREHARRLLADPRARPAISRFHDQWLDLDRVPLVRVDPAVYADDWDPAAEKDWSGELRLIKASVAREAQLFVERVVFDAGGTLADLLTDHEGFASEHTVHLYGLTVDDLTDAVVDRTTLRLLDEQREEELVVRSTTWPATQRAGLLTLAAPLAVNAHPVHPSPVHRGKLVLERLLCEDAGTPPTDALTATLPDSPEVTETNRARLEARTSPAACMGCHAAINPLGFAFEHYDALGGWRDLDFGQTIDSAGALRTAGGVELAFADAVELAHQLAASDAVHDCYTRQWLRYALGREPAGADLETLAALQVAFRASGGDVRGLLVELVASDAFRRAPGGAP